MIEAQGSSKSKAQVVGRVVAIDLARVLAIAFMVQGHTLDVLLAPEYRQGAFFDFWLFLRGLTAPMFLVLAGASFTVSTARRWELSISDFGTMARRLSRFGLFVVLGYLMHMPARSFSDLKYVSDALWRSWWQVDVLQCVAASLIMLQVLVLIARTPRRFALATLGIGAAIVLTAPFVWAVEWTRYMPEPLAAYLNGRTDSLFPLFPWTAYICAGAALGYLYHQFAPKHASKIVAATGVTMLLAGTILQRLPITLFHGIDYWKTSPNLFLLRVGAVCLVLATLAAVAEWMSIRSRIAQTLARESLFVYVAHVMVLYGSSWTLGLRHVIGATLTPVNTIATIALLLPAMAAAGVGWNWCKRTVKPMAKDFAYAAASGFVRIAG